MKNIIASSLVLCVLALGVTAQVGPPPVNIKRSPTGANVNADGDTTVFITFAGLSAIQQAGEALWCAELVPAVAPELGNKCKPGTIFGRLPARFDRSALQGGGVFTDIMAIPASVSRRALQSAQGGHDSSFFYVREFVDTSGGGANEYVTVTCILAGRGAGVPLALNDVRVSFQGHAEDLVYAARRGAPPPPVKADLTYNGSGRLRGRWEVLFPGEAAPADADLMTEASLRTADRMKQQRYTVLERFDVFLPPNGKYALQGPNPARIPTAVDGLYSLLLRVEVSDDKSGDVDLAGIGAGAGVEHHGAVADFPMPTLRYRVASADGKTRVAMQALRPSAERPFSGKDGLIFEWSPAAGTAVYRLVVRDAEFKTVLTAVTKVDSTKYLAPTWIQDACARSALSWQVTALDKNGRAVAGTDWAPARPAD